MGFAASQARLLMLTARKSDLELQGQFINQARLQLSNSVGSLMSLQADLGPENPQVQQLQFRIAAIQELDKGLELQMRRIDTQREAITTELEAVRKVITVNITSSFKIFS